MPNSPSAKKALRQNQKRRERHRAQRSALRTVIKKCRTAIAGDDPEAAAEAVRVTVKRLDQAAAKGLIHKNVAARTKSRLARLRAKAAASSNDE